MALAHCISMPFFAPSQGAHLKNLQLGSNLLIKSGGFGHKMSPLFCSSKRSGKRLLLLCAIAEPSTLETVQNVIAKQLSVQPSFVTPASKFADLGADSLDTVEIMMNLEENFKISLGEEGAEKIVTVQDAANMIQEVLSSSHKK